MSDIKITEHTISKGGLAVAKSWSEMQMIPDINQAPKTIDFGKLWNELFNNNTPYFSREVETAWGFDQNNGTLELEERVDGFTTQTSLKRPHTLDIHTEPGYTQETLSRTIGKQTNKITAADMFGASLPKNYLPDVNRLLKNPETKSSIIMRMEKDGLWAISLALKTNSYRTPTDNERIGYFGRFGRDEKVKYNLSFDKKLAKFGVATYRGFIKFPPTIDGNNYLRLRK
jgi:hypothetical protein